MRENRTADVAEARSRELQAVAERDSLKDELKNVLKDYEQAVASITQRERAMREVQEAKMEAERQMSEVEKTLKQTLRELEHVREKATQSDQVLDEWEKVRTALAAANAEKDLLQEQLAGLHFSYTLNMLR